MIRLDKFLSNHGLGSRKQVKQAIRNAQVHVNHVLIKDEATKIDENIDKVYFDGELINYKPYVYIMLNKPQGYLSATKDNYQETVLDLIDGYEHYDLSIVGRLDKDTEGFILLTNDGLLTRTILFPKHKIPKKYYFELNKDISEAKIKMIESGIEIDTGYTCMPANIKMMNENAGTIEIYEGKFHQVKKMFEAVGLKIVYLKRLSIKGLELDKDLELGDYRELKDEEIEFLKAL